MSESILAGHITGSGFATGSYVGTGTSGSTNKNTLTFDKPIRFLFVGPSTSDGGYVKEFVAGATGAGSYYNGSSYLRVEWSGDFKTVSWYSSNSATHQCNALGVTHHYFVIF